MFILGIIGSCLRNRPTEGANWMPKSLFCVLLHVQICLHKGSFETAWVSFILSLLHTLRHAQTPSHLLFVCNNIYMCNQGLYTWSCVASEYYNYLCTHVSWMFMECWNAYITYTEFLSAFVESFLLFYVYNISPDKLYALSNHFKTNGLVLWQLKAGGRKKRHSLPHTDWHGAHCPLHLAVC